MRNISENSDKNLNLNLLESQLLITKPKMNFTKNYADRLNKIPPYLFAEIDRAITKKRAEGVDVISLGIGDPDLPTPQHIIDALNDAAEDPKNHRYPSYTGLLEFREAVSKYYKRRFNVSLEPENEVVTLIGSKEGIAHIAPAFVNPGDVVLVPSPAYPVYEVGTILAGGSPHIMPLLSENEFKPNLSEIPKDIARKAKLMFLNYPNAPTAETAGREFFSEVVDFARDNEVIACHDNPYTEMCFDGYLAPSFLEVKGAKEIGIEFNSLSKTYNMTGWRIGMVSGNADVIAGLGKVKENVDSGVFQAVQHAGIAALNGSQECVFENNKIIQKRRDFMVDSLNELGWDVKKPKATFYLWFKTPDCSKSTDFAKKVLDETGVVITPGTGFGKYGENYIRIALTQKLERLKEAVARLSEFKF